METIGTKKYIVRLLLVFSFILLVNSADAATASNCTIGDSRQGLWIWIESTASNCYYYTGPPYAPTFATIPASGKLITHEIIQDNYKITYYTMIWNASQFWPVVSYMSGSPGDAKANQACWNFAQLLGYQQQIGSTSPFEGLYSAGKAIWRWTDKNCDKEDLPLAPNPDTGSPKCNQVSVE